MGKVNSFLLVFLLFFIAVASSQSVTYDSNILEGELWIPLQPLDPDLLERPPTDAAMVKIALQEAQYYLSGMIYGWDFSYVPLDIKREVKEEILLTPRGSIPWGDAGLKVLDVFQDVKTECLRVSVRYLLKPNELARRHAWGLTDLNDIGGSGKFKASDHFENRQGAILSALKEAVRSFYRSRIYDKPAKIKGIVCLKAFPLFGQVAGQLICGAQFRMKTELLKTYDVY